MNPSALHEAFSQELAKLLDAVLAGDLVTDWASVERRVVRALGALMRLQRCHRVDRRGRCPICRATLRWWWPWPKRVSCTVHAALGFHLRQPERFVLSVITGNAATVEGRS